MRSVKPRAAVEQVVPGIGVGKVGVQLVLARAVSETDMDVIAFGQGDAVSLVEEDKRAGVRGRGVRCGVRGRACITAY